jgi:hypothetical protein
MSAAVTEQAILQALRDVPTEHWPDVLHYLNALQGSASATVDPGRAAQLADRTWTAAALQQSPRPVQDAILREQAARLIARYRRDPHLGEGVSWWTASEIGRLPVDQRDILLEASATVAAEAYQNDPELTAFEAFGEDDLYADSANDEPFRGSPTEAR